MKCALLGGTFDPVHNGHLALAEAACRELGVDKVVFIPAYIPPHKMNQSISPLHHRLAMLSWVCTTHPLCEVLLIEAEKKKTVYTVDTLRELHLIYPHDEFFFLVGSDFLYEYQTWKQPEELVKLATFVIAPRPGFAIETVPQSMRVLSGEFPPIASRIIRSKAQKGEDISSYVPAVVAEYITEHSVYKTHENN